MPPYAPINRGAWRTQRKGGSIKRLDKSTGIRTHVSTYATKREELACLKHKMLLDCNQQLTAQWNRADCILHVPPKINYNEHMRNKNQEYRTISRQANIFITILCNWSLNSYLLAVVWIIVLIPFWLSVTPEITQIHRPHFLYKHAQCPG